MSAIPKLQFVKLQSTAFVPTKGTTNSAGFDLRSPCDCTVPARGKRLIFTNLQIKLPDGCYGRIAPRSGLSLHHHLDIGAGVVDADYTGNVGVLIFNHGPADFQIRVGDKIAQLICEKICYPIIEEVANLYLVTNRGENGFGSTG
ncbi:uncharacterized protein isoform X2 [Rhodnius prolixus]